MLKLRLVFAWILKVFEANLGSLEPLFCNYCMGKGASSEENNSYPNQTLCYHVGKPAYPSPDVG